MRRKAIAIALVCLAFAFAIAHARPMLMRFDATVTFNFWFQKPHAPLGQESRPAAKVLSEALHQNTSGLATNSAPAGEAKIKASAPLPADKPKLDVVQISTSGLSSVFAGRAEPGASVTVLENEVPVATVTANDQGDWSLATEHKFKSANPALTIRALQGKIESLNDQKGHGIGDPAVSLGDIAGDPIVSPLALLKNFERLVAVARNEAQGHRQPQSVAVANVVGPAISSTIGTPKEALRTEPPAPAATGSTTRLPSADVPIPMTFLFDQATLTSDGERTARLLLEYLVLKKFTSITLTGHADERGTAEYNVELSRKRLEAISGFLAKGGYRGKMQLVPKGFTEPFGGINRSRFSREDLMQLDRRVELRNAM